MPAPKPTTTDDVGFSIWDLSATFDINGPLLGRIVQVPSSLAQPAKAFFAQISNNDASYAFRWTPIKWFHDYASASAWVSSEFKTIARARLGL